MTQETLKYLRVLGMVLLSGAAVGIMVLVSVRTNRKAEEEKEAQAKTAKSAEKAAVAVRELKLEPIELLDQFTGKLRYWERYSLEFEIAGRVTELGKNEEGEELDEGDTVKKDQMLARLDDRMLRALKNEATAQWERASTNLRRAQDLRDRGVEGISDTEYLDRLTDEKLAKAQMEIATKNLDDSVLRSPVDGIISRRLTKAGESVTPQKVVFELVQIDPILLVLDVPESRVREVEARAAKVRSWKEYNDKNNDNDNKNSVEPKQTEKPYRVYVDMESRDRFNRKWPRLDGVVRQVSETADERTGLFEVEVRVPNPDGLLSPGMVARANLVTEVIEGYRIPAASVKFRRDRASFFTIERISEETDDVRAMYWKVGDSPVYKAREIELKSWVQQGPDVIVPAEEYSGLQFAVVRGQLRLASGQLVRLVPFEEDDEGLLQPELPVRPLATASAAPK